MSVTKWLNKHTNTLTGKVVAISGATGGLGRELCRHLAAIGASLWLLDRNPDRSKRLIAALQAQYPSLSARHSTLDLEQFDTVRHVADALVATPPDILILNAGAYAIPHHPCDTGWDNVFQINFVSPYYLARRLKPCGCRVVAVGSIAHNYSKTDPHDVDFSKRTSASLAYGNAKRYLMFSLLALYDGDAGLSIVHPGITLANITAHYPPWLFALIKHPMKVLFMSPRKASLCILQGVFADCQANEWIGPRWFSIWGFPKVGRLTSCSPTERQHIRMTAEKLYADLHKTV